LLNVIFNLVVLVNINCTLSLTLFVRENCLFQSFFTCLRLIWLELDAIHTYGRISTCSCSLQRDRQYLHHFLMHLCPEFEAFRGQPLHRSPLLSLDDALTELIAEETWLHVLGTGLGPSKAVLAATSCSQPPPLLASPPTTRATPSSR